MSASFSIFFIGETAASSAQESSKSNTPGDTEEVQKDAKDFKTDDSSEAGKMIEEERSETGRVRTLKMKFDSVIYSLPVIIIWQGRLEINPSILIRFGYFLVGISSVFDSAFESRQKKCLT